MSDIALEEMPQHRSLWGDVWSQFRTHKGALIGSLVFLSIVLIVVLGPFVHTLDPQYLDIVNKNLPPSWEHPMGTDNLGRDTFAQVMAGGRVSLLVGVVAMALSLFLGAAIGVLADVVSRFTAVCVWARDRHIYINSFCYWYHQLDADCQNCAW